MISMNDTLPPQAVVILRNAERHLRRIDPDERHRLYDFVRATMGKIAPVDAFYIAFFSDETTLIVPYTYDQQEVSPPGVLTYGPYGLSAWLKQHKRPYTFDFDNGRLLGIGHRFGDTTRASKDTVAVPLVDTTSDVPRVFGVASIQSYQPKVYDASTVQAFVWLCESLTAILLHAHSADRRAQALLGQPDGLAPTLPELIEQLSHKLEGLRTAIVEVRSAAQAGQHVDDKLTELDQLCRRTQDELFATITLPSNEVAEALGTLTARERQIANLIADGLTNDEVAQHLTIAVKTVKTHLTSINRKLQVNNRLELAAKLRPYR
jgi:DNA-binding CsgD family transcriptional regulator